MTDNESREMQAALGEALVAMNAVNKEVFNDSERVLHPDAVRFIRMREEIVNLSLALEIYWW